MQLLQWGTSSGMQINVAVSGRDTARAPTAAAAGGEAGVQHEEGGERGESERGRVDEREARQHGPHAVHVEQHDDRHERADHQHDRRVQRQRHEHHN